MADKAAVIGTYKGHDIPAWIDAPERGGRYEYVGIAVEDNKGGVWLSQLSDDEIVAFPGLIYSRAAFNG